MSARRNSDADPVLRGPASCVACCTHVAAQEAQSAGSKTIRIALGVILTLASIRAASQEAASPHAGGTDLNLPQPQSKSEALSPVHN